MCELEQALCKPPKAAMLLPAAQLQQAVLGVLNRESDLEQILRRQYEQLESAWIRHRVHDAIAACVPLHKTFVDGSPETGMRLHSIHGSPVPIDFQKLADVLWHHMDLAWDPSRIALHDFHSSLKYLRHDMKLPDAMMPILEVRSASRRYVEPGRVVFAWRSILEDPCFPHDEKNLIDARIGWSVVETKGFDQCYVSMYEIVPTPIFPDTVTSREPAVGTWTELLLQSSHEFSERFNAAFTPALRAVSTSKKPTVQLF
ncbi:hypothetical protein ACHHYP_02136 [Achlya hypogyna]|uniref:START domain-containing protein n=1 Tax=Achlya hypogyna TaxID=1202772 RepID=A0A1V9Z7A1_ACHHY|nr:hypothetical protein ACHHYP_02136 [Achlya hypogyna]